VYNIPLSNLQHKQAQCIISRYQTSNTNKHSVSYPVIKPPAQASTVYNILLSNLQHKQAQCIISRYQTSNTSKNSVYYPVIKPLNTSKHSVSYPVIKPPTQAITIYSIPLSNLQHKQAHCIIFRYQTSNTSKHNV